MREAGTKTGSDDPRARVAAWRVDCLRRRGLDVPLAQRLAEDPGYDLHALLELLDRGCPADLAARILAPCEEDSELC